MGRGSGVVGGPGRRDRVGLPGTPQPLAAPERGALLTNVTVVNPGGSRVEGQTLRVVGGRIDSVGASDEPATGAHVKALNPGSGSVIVTPSSVTLPSLVATNS